LHVVVADDASFGLIGGVIGASFAVLVAEELFASGCEVLLRITSAGQIRPVGTPPSFILIDRAIRDEGRATTTFRETATTIASRRDEGVLAVEMEAAALYAFANARGKRVLCFAHVTNHMALTDGDFEKDEANGARDALRLIDALVGVIDKLSPHPSFRVRL